ncbi:immediate early response gene 2 protein [Alligator mississippiensis]|uniref:Immediate early response 2 protein n=1 Tax=Alligator mississippiensis TaxID=8496 RepID=A0A151MZQ0_ALLMI|nr:immediate early response gene 2 protein [Alligator mississippiensis]KYO30043.1 immediate early response 2 protein [Alligator mississippiensis]
MEVQKEAQRIMSLSVWKLYHSRLQRGGLRLHRSLQLSQVLRSARELYLAARAGGEEDGAGPEPPQLEPLERGKAADPDPLGCVSVADPAPMDQVIAADTKSLDCVNSADPDPMDCSIAADPAPTDCVNASDLDPMDCAPAAEPEPPAVDTQLSSAELRPPPVRGPCTKPSRKRRSPSWAKPGAAEAGLAPSKKARLEAEERDQQPQRQEGPFPSLAKVLQSRFAVPSPPCRRGQGVLGLLVRAVAAC